MRLMVKSRVAILALSLWLGAVSIIPGCGSSRSNAAIPEGGGAEVPAVVAAQLRACAEERKTHLGAARHTISFELHFSEDGQVDPLSLDDSTLEDQGLEACMVGVLRSMSLEDLPLRGPEQGSYEPMAPESRGFMAQEQVLLCLASPPCLLSLGMLIGASFLVVQIYVHAAQSSDFRKAHPWVAPRVPKVPTAERKSIEECIALYVKCTETPGKSPCNVCLGFCRVNKRWPDDMCPP